MIRWCARLAHLFFLLFLIHLEGDRRTPLIFNHASGRELGVPGVFKRDPDRMLFLLSVESRNNIGEALDGAPELSRKDPRSVSMAARKSR